MTDATSVADKVGALNAEIMPRASTAVTRQEQSPPSLAELAAEFRAMESNIAGGVRLAIASQIRCGELLELMQERVAKELGTGYWGAWVQLNCGVTLRQVQRYIRKAKEFRALNQKSSCGATSMSLLIQRDLQRLNSDPQKRRSAKKKPAK